MQYKDSYQGRENYIGKEFDGICLDMDKAQSMY